MPFAAGIDCVSTIGAFVVHVINSEDVARVVFVASREDDGIDTLWLVYLS